MCECCLLCKLCDPCFKAVACFGKCVIAIINIPFLIIGIAFIVLGGLILGSGTFMTTFQSQIVSSLNSLNSALSASGITIDTTNINLATLLQGVGIGAICFGALILIIALLGYFGTLCPGCDCLLYVYITLCCLLLLIQVVLIACIYAGPTSFDSTLKATLQSQIDSDYKGISGDNAVSLGWNGLMYYYQCCGLDNYTDFQTASNWPTLVTYSGSSVSIQLPLACCSGSYDASLSCAQTSSTSNYKDTGCYSKLWTDAKSFLNQASVIVIVAAILILQAGVITLAILVAIGKKKNLLIVM